MMNRSPLFRDPVSRDQIFRDPVFCSLASFASDLDRACAAPARAAVPTAGRAAAPAMNIYASESALTIEAEVPGMALDDIEIVLNGDELTIRGIRRGTRNNNQPEGSSVLRRERPVGSFERTFTLPAELDRENASASLEHGVLTIALPKSQAARPRRLAINGASPKVETQVGEANGHANGESGGESGVDPAQN